MIKLENVSKAFHGSRVLADVNLQIPSGSAVAVLGANGAGKTTLLRLISGLLAPDRGTISRIGTVSWPVGFGGAFHPDLTGAQNVRFVARLYKVDVAQVTEFVRDFAELGAQFYDPLRVYSSGMRARLAFGLSMAIRFDTYLIDEVTAVGDGAFRQRSSQVFQDRLYHAGAIVVSHSMPLLRRHCETGIVLHGAKAWEFASLEEAIAFHQICLDAQTAKDHVA